MPVVVLLALVVVSTGCLDASTRVTVHDEDRVTVVIEVFPDRARWNDLGGEGRARQFAAAVGRLVPEGIEVERIDGERAPGIRLTWEDVPVAALTAPLAYAGAPLPALFERFDLSHDDGTWELDAVVPPPGAIVMALAPSFPGGTDRQIMVTMTVQLPGRVVGTNAQSHDWSSATWELSGSSGESVSLTMRSEPGLGLTPAFFVVTGLIAIVGVGVILVVWSERMRVRRELHHAAVQVSAELAQGATRPTGPSAGDPTTRRRNRRAKRGSADPVSPPVTAADRPKGMYQDISGDETVALPVGGAAWGPAPVQRPVDAAPAEEFHRDVEVAAAAPATPVVAPPGWYPDPDRPGVQRFWDGTGWTDHRS